MPTSPELPLGSGDSADQRWVPTDGRTRSGASRASMRLLPGAWLRGRIARRRGLSEKYSVPNGTDEVLARLVDLPLSVWSYGWEDESVRHLGPMAQDFATSFGLGDNDRMIQGVDAAGVCMAAIQALHKRVVGLELELDALKASLPTTTNGN